MCKRMTCAVDAFLVCQVIFYYINFFHLIVITFPVINTLLCRRLLQLVV